MADHISFDTIPGSIRVPGQYIEFNTRNAVQGLPQNPQKMLIIAPMLTAGRQAALTPVQLFSDADAADLFGGGSWAHLMTRQAFLNNPYLDLTVIGVADGGGSVAATASVSLSGTATGSGIVTIRIGGKAYSVAVARGEAAAAVATRIRAAVTADSAAVATTGGADGALVFTMKNKGQIGNEPQFDVAVAVAGLSQSGGTGFASGAGDADIAPALANVAGKQYHIIVSAFNDDANNKALSSHISQVSNAIEQRGCVGVIGWRGTLATGTAATAKINDGRVVCGWYKNAAESGCMIAAGLGAVMAFEEDPARPLNTLEVKGLAVTADADWPLFAECNNALYNGLTPLTVVAGKVQIMRAVSTYTKSAANADDPSLLDITTIRTLDYVRRAIKERIALRFPRDKLSDNMVPSVRSEILDVLYKLEEIEVIENVEANKPKLLLSRSVQDAKRLNAAIPSDVVNGLHVFAGRIDLIL